VRRRCRECRWKKKRGPCLNPKKIGSYQKYAGAVWFYPVHGNQSACREFEER